MSEEVFYFDILPKELNYLILFNIPNNDMTKLIEIRPLEGILDESNFWEQRVKYNFPNVTWELIPDYLYRYNKRQTFTQHFNRYYKLNLAYEKTIKILLTFKDSLSVAISVWYEEFTEEERKDFDNDIKIFLQEDVSSFYTFRLNCINNFDVLNLWYTNKVEDNIELDIEKYYKLEESYIMIYLQYDMYSFGLKSNNEELIYNVEYIDIFNALLHLYCNGGSNM